MTIRIERLTRTDAHGGLTLVVFPHAGGSPRYYAPWSLLASAPLELHGVTYPGRDLLIDEPVADSVTELAAECANALASIARTSPVVFFGHSMGGFVAFETARALERDGISIASLIVSGCDAAHLGTADRWHLASDDDLIAHIAALDPRAGAALAVPALRRLFLPTLRADYRLSETYRGHADDSVGCPVHAVYGVADPDIVPDGPARWATHARNEFQLATFPGGHFYVAEHGARILDYIAGTVGLGVPQNLG
ncbi:thioesterase [Nocardia cyriacigeorgica]|uniref:Thioesterase TesA n=1 Tax=Nocardia cyriacigeorgica TaxID=135487 RepID=A0A6P1D426_9NOCA|nr:alpha/beta fold hydrolase [Nocardia cyriacigeorgica]NEW44289.1 thioesterase [Nocardia cyriacigeorgica]NEW51172.1 thioesterase [Nocardia cyriacigeorgica]